MKIVWVILALIALIFWQRRSGYSTALGYDVSGTTLFTGQTNSECQTWCNGRPDCAGFVQYQNNTCQCKSNLDGKYQVNGATVYIK
jgi:hypothetical protein